jgi:hypothetical protein
VAHVLPYPGFLAGARLWQAATKLVMITIHCAGLTR